MNDTTFKLRIDKKDLEEWRARANGKPLAQWIKERCSANAESFPEAPIYSEKHSAVLHAQTPKMDKSVLERASIGEQNPAPRLDEPAYKSHPTSCVCFLCGAARTAGLKK